ncbi:hypothetical protein IQ238_08590 [Pleurocapsales cyanobacterium LEGE 06147]|nr:hypothetical protein [Pleurocapsales cyanobacterium LEGE 06147]
MDSKKKNFAMKKEYSTETMTIRPEELMEELGIKKSKYYQVLKELEIKADKDSTGKSYLTESQAEQVKSYLLNNMHKEENQDLNNNSIIKVNDSNLATSTNTNSEENIYVEPEDPIDNFDIDKLLRKAAQLKARELATPDLAIRAIADRMTEDDLPEDLKQKVFAVREAVNPKWTPAELADKILAQHRSNRGGS